MIRQFFRAYVLVLLTGYVLLSLFGTAGAFILVAIAAWCAYRAVSRR